jgi:hypothetical protein
MKTDDLKQEGQCAIHDVSTRFDSIEICTYSKDSVCKLIEDKHITCNGKCSENSGKCKFYIGLRRV